MRTAQQWKTKQELQDQCNSLNTMKNRVHIEMKILAKKRSFEGLTPSELDRHQHLNERLLEMKIEEAHLCYAKNMI